MIINHFNFILLMGRYHIYKSKKAGENLDMYRFLVDCKKHLILEQNIMAAKNESEKFNKKWQEQYENL